ncbi:MAG TPA: FHA domain-containing protein [Actinomycetota bacterium]|nr:FHA domain-containing protein [Actinomycetota bacterium]
MLAHEPRLVPLEGERLTVGTDASNDLALPADATLSRLHAVFERYPSGWCVRDLDSRNGTFVNGQRILRERPLRPGDELRVGATRLVYRSDQPTTAKGTQASEPPPELTRREREVLLVLCHTVLGGAAFTEPASIREIADALVITEAAVKQHLAHLYDKFAIHGGGERRRVQLANEALRRGAVTIAELRQAAARDAKRAR